MCALDRQFTQYLHEADQVDRIKHPKVKLIVSRFKEPAFSKETEYKIGVFCSIAYLTFAAFAALC